MLKKLPGGKLYTNCYVIADEESREAAIIDPVGDFDDIRQYVESQKLQVKYIFLTHGHGDHMGALPEAKVYFKAPIGIHPADEEMLQSAGLNMSLSLSDKTIEYNADIYLKDNDVLMLGQKEIRIIHTPGHTKGGVCILFGEDLITGDTLFCDGIGRTDLYGGDYDTLIASVTNKLFVLPDNTLVHPGHGASSTISAEKGNNSFF